jgi:hypothetical protein
MNASVLTRLTTVLIASLGMSAGCITQATGPDGLALDNGTTFDVSLYVNGTAIATVPAGTEIPKIPSHDLPSLPWSITVRGSDGRSLLSLNVDPKDWTTATSGEVPVKGQSAWERLTCGELEVWAGDRPSGAPLDPAETGMPDPLCAP